MHQPDLLIQSPHEKCELSVIMVKNKHKITSTLFFSFALFYFLFCFNKFRFMQEIENNRKNWTVNLLSFLKFKLFLNVSHRQKKYYTK